MNAIYSRIVAKANASGLTLMRLLMTLGLVAVVSACSTVGTERTAQMKSGASIAPLSLMGEVIPIRVVGTTVFQNERAEAKVPDWQIDTYTESVAARLLKDGKRFTVIQPDTTEAHAIKPKVGSIAAGTVFEGGNDKIIALARNSGADYVLVMLPALYGDPYFGTNQAFTGYGVYQRSFLGIKRAVNFLTMRAALFDGKTGEEIARTSGYVSSPRSPDGWMESDNLLMSEENNHATRQAIETLINKLLTTLLIDLKVTLAAGS